MVLKITVFFITFASFFLIGFFLLNGGFKGESADATAKPKAELYKEKFGEKSYTKSDISFNSTSANVRINLTSGVSEPKIVVNPSDKNNIIVAANDFLLSGNQARYFYSINGGLNWEASVIPLSSNSGFDQTTDPALTFDAEGNVYHAIVHYQTFGNGDGIFVNRSDDKGLTWKETAAEVKKNNDAVIFEDRPAITADLSNTFSRNNIYVVWTSIGSTGNTILFSKSINKGETFSSAIELASGEVNAADVKVDGSGNIVVAYLEKNSAIKVRNSFDRGETFNQEVTAAVFQHSGVFNEESYLLKKNENGTGFRVKSYPSLATDQNSNKAYIVFSGKNNEDLSDIFIIQSEDNGSSWGDALRVNNDNTINDQFFPEISIDESSNLFVMWQDSRDDINNINIDTYLAHSTNGNNFSNEKISTKSFNPNEILLGNYIGDYNGLAVSGSTIYPVWTDGRNNNFDIYAGIFTGSPTSIEDVNLPSDFSVNQNYPNPFNPSTIINFSIPAEGNVTIKLYDILGKEIATLMNEVRSAGYHNLIFDSSRNSLASGTYIYSITHNSKTISQKMILSK